MGFANTRAIRFEVSSSDLLIFINSAVARELTSDSIALTPLRRS